MAFLRFDQGATSFAQLYTGLPLFTWCEIHGLFHDFPGPFQGNPRPSLSSKTWMLYTFFSKQTLLFGFNELADPDNGKQPMTGHFRQKSGLVKSQFLFYSAVVESKIF